MSAKEKLIRIIDGLSEERIEQIIDFAEFLDQHKSIKNLISSKNNSIYYKTAYTS